MKHVVRVWTYDKKGDDKIKEGDVVSIRPVNEQSIINVNENAKKTIAFIVDGLTPEEIQMMTEPEYEGGKTEKEYEAELQAYYDSCDQEVYLIWEDEAETIPVLKKDGTQATGIDYVPNANSLPMPEHLVTVKKRRFSIPLQTIKDGWCPDLDLAKVRDKNDTYQPKVSEVNALEKVAFCKDKSKGTFKYAAKKVVE